MIEKFNNPVIYPAKCGTPGNIAVLSLRDAMPTLSISLKQSRLRFS